MTGGQIRVHVAWSNDREEYRLRYTDPVTRRRRTKSAGTDNEKKAQRAAALWEAELNDGRFGTDGECPWEVFRSRYEDEHLSGLDDDTFRRSCTALSMLAKTCQPGRLCDLTAEGLSLHVQGLRRAGREPATIRTHLAHIQAALNWARAVGLIARIPEMPRVARGRRKKMKGRPLTNAEFIQLLRAIPRYMPRRLCRGWIHFYKGLWWSGLRLEESLGLSWDDPSCLMVDLSRKRPVLIVPAEAEKGGRDRILPVAPEFGQFLAATPTSERHGTVFQPMGLRGRPTSPHRISIMGSRIGKASGITVHESGKARHPTIHDLRRSFGLRWANRVMPRVLMRLMRHESIQTTMDFYVGRDADDVAEILWDAVEGSTGGSRTSDAPED